MNLRQPSALHPVLPSGWSPWREVQVAEAAARETLEETGLRVVPRQVLLIEDLLSQRFKMCKVWFACNVIGGRLTATKEARKEGIVEAAWFSPEELSSETVFPFIISEREWSLFGSPGYAVEVSAPRLAGF